MRKAALFERVFFKQLLYSGKQAILHCKLDGTDKQTTTFHCENAVVIASSDFFPQSSCFSAPTLLIPASKDQPMIDCMLIDGNNLVAFQLTIKNPACNVPQLTPKPNVYSAIYNGDKWNDLCKRINYQSAGSNFTEEAFWRLLGVKTKVSIDENKHIIIQNNSFSDPLIFNYFIVTPAQLLSNDAYSNLAKNYPWVRVIYRESLETIFSTEFVDAFYLK